MKSAPPSRDANSSNFLTASCRRRREALRGRRPAAGAGRRTAGRAAASIQTAGHAARAGLFLRHVSVCRADAGKTRKSLSCAPNVASRCLKPNVLRALVSHAAGLRHRRASRAAAGQPCRSGRQAAAPRGRCISMA
eukprot:364707-Chlamydomonas_euryale.AAC.6